MNAYLPYEPPAREFADTMLAFKDFQLASTWGVRVESDPLGPVNSIVRLMRGNRPVKSVLTRVQAGATVRLVRDSGQLTIREVFDFQERIWAAREVGGNPIEIESIQPPGWRVEVDGKTVLAVTDIEMQPPTPPAPRVPLWRRFRYWTATRARSAADGLAGRLGYVGADEAGGGW